MALGHGIGVEATKKRLGNVTEEDIIRTIEYIQKNNLKCRRAETTFFVYKGLKINYSLNSLTEILNNNIKKNKNSFSKGELGTWSLEKIYDSIKFSKDLRLITPYNDSGLDYIGKYRVDLIKILETKYTKTIENDEYVQFNYGDKNVKIYKQISKKPWKIKVEVPYKSKKKGKIVENNIYEISLDVKDVEEIKKHINSYFCPPKTLIDIANNSKEADNKNIGDKQIVFPFNQIIYGPPGTGKTYNTIIKAMSIIDNTEYKDVDDEKYQKLKERFKVLKRKGQIEFVTFHQSYSYEEFIEGIKPTTDGDRQFENKDGIFKIIAKEALFEKLITNYVSNDSLFYKIIEKFKEEYPIGSILKTKENNEFEIVKYTEESIRIEPITKKRSTLSISYKPLEEMYLISKEKKIESRKELEEAMNNRYKGLSSYYLPILKIIEGLNVDNENIEYNKEFKEKVIKEFYQNKISINETNKVPYVLIIDEINRGNISKIFGELITLLEDDKRLGAKHELTTKLPYSQEDFGIPNNLYIIGTMNTADKSLALLDVALRRRFEFIAMYPKSNLVKDYTKKGEENRQTVLDTINNKILEKLCSKNNKHDYLIGHTYFMCEDGIENILKRKIIPLLMEYFNGKISDVEDIINATGYKAEFNTKYPYEWYININD